MAKNEKTGIPIGKLASKAMRLKNKANITLEEIRRLGSSANTQRPDHKKKS